MNGKIEAEQPTLPSDITDVVGRALTEDVGTGDVTASLIPETLQATAEIVSRELAILCGTTWFDEVFRQLDDAINISWDAKDGDAISPDQKVCFVEGPAQALLTGERTALNFLQILSGTATAARRYADAVEGTGARILDTRKTLPGLRTAQKYAVRCGGCYNHRMGLFDAVLVKENHILAAGSISAAILRSREMHSSVEVEVEVENLNELADALEARADIVLLDNFDLHLLKEAVEINAGRAKLEVSGGISLETVRDIADVGVDYISVGALTKHLRAADFSMRFQSGGSTLA